MRILHRCFKLVKWRKALTVTITCLLPWKASAHAGIFLCSIGLMILKLTISPQSYSVCSPLLTHDWSCRNGGVRGLPHSNDNIIDMIHIYCDSTKHFSYNEMKLKWLQPNPYKNKFHGEGSLAPGHVLPLWVLNSTFCWFPCDLWNLSAPFIVKIHWCFWTAL